MNVTSKDKVEENMEPNTAKITTNKGEILEVLGVLEKDDKSEEKKEPEGNTDEKALIDEGELVEQPEDKSEPIDPPQNSVLSELEYAAISKTLSTIAELRKHTDSDDAAAQINLLEMSIWDDMVKRFGFESVEAAQSAGFSFGLKRLYVIECVKK
jgi:hypothetical protein